MRRLLTLALVLSVMVVFGGCGSDEVKLRTKGRIVKGGEDFIPEEGEFLAITFVPIVEPGKFAMDYYFAEVDQEAGTFTAAGKDLKGLPEGKYRVAVELMRKKKDQFGGRFDPANSPFVFDIDTETEEIVIDLDQPPSV